MRVASLFTAGLICGCAHTVSGPPATVDQLRSQQAQDPNGFTNDIIIIHNACRVLDTTLPARGRIDSLAVLDRLDGDNVVQQQRLVAVLSDGQNPDPLRLAVLELLTRRNYRDLAPAVVAALPNSRDGAFRQALLDWLMKHPSQDVLAEVVKLWASEPGIDPQRDERYRRAVEQMSGLGWADALLAALNNDSFVARGSAIELLASRLTEPVLRERILAMPAGNEAVRALRFYARRLDYLPTQRNELLSAVVIFVSKREVLDDACELADQWKTQGGYRFNIRDVHLLSRLHGDPQRKLPARAEMVARLTNDLARRPHAARSGKGDTAMPVDFAEQADRLTMADITNLYLLNEMLGRRRVQLALRVMAERERAGKAIAGGGLIFYENGRADARLYPADNRGGDLPYQPSDRMTQDASDCLAYFFTRFQDQRNAPQPGPSAEDLEYVRRQSCYCLLLTSVDADTFTAVYCTPGGVTISLGNIPFGKEEPTTDQNPAASASTRSET